MKFIWALLFLISFSSFGQKKCQVAFYNCENLFDTLHATHKKDYEYLPSSEKNWNTKKYFEKLNHMARVILAIGDWEGPDIIGFCEIENRKVLNDLLQYTVLKQYNYAIIHQESRDVRGIDVACIYKREKFKLVDYNYYQVNLSDSVSITRDLLHVEGLLENQDTLHMFFNHWPSRYGGQAKSNPKRREVANKLRIYIDSLQEKENQHNILILGDFNDNPTDSSLVHGLGAKIDSTNNQEYDLLNTSYFLQHKMKLGTHKYKHDWSCFDQIIITQKLLNQKNSTHTKVTNSEVFSPEWLFTEDYEYGGKKPFRTYRGTRYLGGYSDHLPISITLHIK